MTGCVLEGWRRNIAAGQNNGEHSKVEHTKKWRNVRGGNLWKMEKGGDQELQLDGRGRRRRSSSSRSRNRGSRMEDEGDRNKE